MQPFLHIDQLRFGRQNALCQAFSAQLDQSGLIILSGKNGVGKSTLLKTLAGLLPVLSGFVSIQNIALPVTASKSFSFFRSNQHFHNLSQVLAYTNTERVKEDYITVGDLIRYGQYPYLSQASAQINQTLFDETVNMLGLNPLLNKYLNVISDGEWQKANIARTLLQDTPIILMDEPSAFLDYEAKSQLFGELKNIASSKNKLIIVSTHDLDLANRYGTHFWHIQDGTLQASDRPFMGQYTDHLSSI